MDNDVVSSLVKIIPHKLKATRSNPRDEKYLVLTIRGLGFLGFQVEGPFLDYR